MYTVVSELWIHRHPSGSATNLVFFLIIYSIVNLQHVNSPLLAPTNNVTKLVELSTILYTSVLSKMPKNKLVLPKFMS